MINYYPRLLPVLLIVSLLYANKEDTESTTDKKQSNNSPLSITTGDSLQFSEIELKNALKTAIGNNGNIQKGYLDYRASQYKAKAETGVFEPNVVTSLNFENKNNPFAINDQQKNVISTGIEGRLHTATKYNIGFTYTDIENPFKRTTEKPTIFTGITVTQPLLKGVWFGAPMVNLKVSKIDLQTAKESYRSLLINTVAEIEKSFWHVCYLNQLYTHSVRSVELAHQFILDSKKRVKAGKMSKIDILEAEVGYASRINSLRAVSQELISASSQLKHLIGDSSTEASTIFKTDSDLLYSLNLDSSFNTEGASLKLLFQYQPDLRTLENHVRREKKVVDFQRDQLLPELNLSGSWGVSTEGATMDIARNYWVEDKKKRVFSAELTLKVPIAGNIKQRNLLKAERTAMQSVKTDVKSYIDELRRAYETSTNRLNEYMTTAQNGAVIVEYRKQLLQNEINKLNAGKSTYREVFEQEEQLMKSRQWHLESLMNIRNTVTEIERIKGTLLISHELEYIESNEPLLAKEVIKISNNNFPKQ